MPFKKKRRYPKVTEARTIDQRLLIEIRDELHALPLAAELKRSEIDQAKEIIARQDAVNERLAKIEALSILVLRAQGIDAEALGEDELALLTEIRAMA